MTSLFTGASSRTIRDLERAVQRNILRRHRFDQQQHGRRYESTKPSNANSKAVQQQQQQPVAFAAWLEPIKIPFRSYERMQERSPLLTQWETTLVIYFLGDLAAQIVQQEQGGGEGEEEEGRWYEPIRGLRAMVIGGIMSIPSFKWFLWLGRHFNYAQHWKSLGVKILVSQMLFTPLFNTYFFGMQTLLAGGSFPDAKERVIKTVPVSWMNSWKLWPAVTAFSFTFIRPQNRSVFAGFIAIGWQTYLSWLNRRAEKGVMDEDKNQEREVGVREQRKMKA
ncbi:hypothetical protein AC578_4901 [Lecanosticta acicola]|uniref:Uncharacterized protein n=1 Tax=Lecanosticta acicola TaxID=111012 RepID=A0AAI8YZL9_9PEZI|nr:hypothetical protein AC578_4901 [Lecanosticta acicola]